MKYTKCVSLAMFLFQKTNLAIYGEHLRNTDSQCGEMSCVIYGNVSLSSPYFVEVIFEKLYFLMEKGEGHAEPNKLIRSTIMNLNCFYWV